MPLTVCGPSARLLASHVAAKLSFEGRGSVTHSGTGLLPLRTVAIVGVGLLGGSVGLGLRRRGLARRVVGTGHRQESLDRALARGAVDEATLDLQAAVAEADLTVLATPVGRIVELAAAARDAFRPGSVVTDVGSTKARLVRDLEAVAAGRFRYVGSHPMAGSEKRGVDEADPELFAGALCFVTPTPQSDPRAVELLTDFWLALGARVRPLNPDQHDRLVASASHLPHLVAAALVHVTPPEALGCIGTGFRDTTRVASGDPRLWTDVCLHNRERLLDALRAFAREVGALRNLLERGTEAELLAWLEAAKTIRDRHVEA
jgi:prephenate dehydrogenase